MSKCLLHKTKLPEFTAYLEANGFCHRPGRGEYQALQVQINGGQWHCVFTRDTMPEHYSVAYPLENVVRQFIRNTKRKS